MPKKVITRRQRKAAEAKRQSESNARATASSETNCDTAAATATNTIEAAKPPSSNSNGTNTESKAVADKHTSPKSTNLEPEQKADDAAELSSDSKSSVTVIVKDKTTQSDKNVFDLLVDENIQKEVGIGAESQTSPSPPPPNEQGGSFSKSLTRRAVATFTKIQKLSKVFNKKMNYKNPPVKVTEPMNLASAELDDTVKTALNGPPGADMASKACSCDFCKVVLNQLLAGKKRVNDKKACKNANRRPPPNAVRATSPGRNSGNETVATPLPAEAKYYNENKTTQTPSTASRRRIIQMLEKKEMLLEKDVVKKIKQLNKQNTKIKTSEKQIKNHPKPISQNASNPDSSNTKPTSAPVNVVKKKPMPRVALAKTLPSVKQKANEPVKTPKPSIKAKQPSKPEISSTVQQVAAAPVDAPPIEVIGNTGYFILTGTDAQLTTQINNLAARNVHIENFVELEPGVTDKVEQQLKQLSMNREQILQRMREKHDMMAKRRTKRSKEPNKYT